MSFLRGGSRFSGLSTVYSVCYGVYPLGTDGISIALLETYRTGHLLRLWQAELTLIADVMFIYSVASYVMDEANRISRGKRNVVLFMINLRLYNL